MVIDVQNYAADPDDAEFRDLTGPDRAKYEYSFDRFAKIALPNKQKLQAAGRVARLEVIYAVIENLTADGRDRSLDYKISGINVAKGSWDAQVCDAITPGADEIVLKKNSSSVFVSTNIDYLFRSLGMRQIIMRQIILRPIILRGVVSDQCVEPALRDACDPGYLVTLVPDACATYPVERLEASVRAIKGYCRQMSTADLVAELAVLR